MQNHKTIFIVSRPRKLNCWLIPFMYAFVLLVLFLVAGTMDLHDTRLIERSNHAEANQH